MPMDARSPSRRGCPSRPLSRSYFFSRYIDSFDMQGAEPLVAFDLLVLDLLTIFERTEAFSLDAGVVNEYILPFGVDDEAESLLHVEPLHRAYGHRSSHKCAARET